MSKSLEIILFMSSWLAIIPTVNWWLSRTPCLTHSTLISVRLVEGLPPWSHLSHPLFELLAPLKKIVCVTWCYLCTLTEAFQASDQVCPNRAKYFRFIRCSGFNVRSSGLLAEQNEKEEKCEEKIQWLQKSKITFIYTCPVGWLVGGWLVGFTTYQPFSGPLTQN